MAMLFRLRRRLAHLICPELGVEARLKAVRLVNGFFDPKAARQVSDCALKEPFLHPDHMAELLAHLRHGRVERAKEILKIVQSVKLHGLPGDDDAAFDALAERFAFLIFGKK